MWIIASLYLQYLYRSHRITLIFPASAGPQRETFSDPFALTFTGRSSMINQLFNGRRGWITAALPKSTQRLFWAAKHGFTLNLFMFSFTFFLVILFVFNSALADLLQPTVKPGEMEYFPSNTRQVPVIRITSAPRAKQVGRGSAGFVSTLLSQLSYSLFCLCFSFYGNLLLL